MFSVVPRRLGSCLNVSEGTACCNDCVSVIFDIGTHLTPAYKPWDQRMCLVPDADLLPAIRCGKASIETGHVERFTQTGIVLRSGTVLEADIVVLATGLKMQVLSGIPVTVEGMPRRPANALGYKGMMLSGFPNLAWVFGYINASWTLKADLTCMHVCRILGHMRRHGYTICVPNAGQEAEALPMLDFSSGYVRRAKEEFPKQGVARPWKLYQNDLADLADLRLGRVDNGALRFLRATARVVA